MVLLIEAVSAHFLFQRILSTSISSFIDLLKMFMGWLYLVQFSMVYGSFIYHFMA